MPVAFILAAVLLTAEKNGVSLTVESETERIDPGRSVMLSLTVKSPAGARATPPNLGARTRGFAVAEDFAEEPVTGKDGSVTETVNWRLVPEPCAERYAILPFVVAVPGGRDFVAGPIRFSPPSAREPVTGGMEADPRKELPPLSGRLVGWIALALAGMALAVTGIVWAVRALARRVKEHRMSPIERAWAELDRLLKKGLPGRGRYKDFYVELTMVVRRYVQRRYGVRAPNLTTEEFFEEAKAVLGSDAARVESLRTFLESADMVKFAGLEATPEMADSATDAARGYLSGDAAGTPGS